MAKNKLDQWLTEMEQEVAVGESGGASSAVIGGGKSLHPGLGAPIASGGEDAMAALWSPASTPQRKTVEDILLASGALDPDKLGQARNVQATSRGKKISQVLLEMGAVKEED